MYSINSDIFISVTNCI